MSSSVYAIGVDYGTNSVRAVVFDAASGEEVGAASYDYPSGESGVLLDPSDSNVARQNPADYIEGFHQSVERAVQAATDADGFDTQRVVGIGIDTTASTPIPVDEKGVPLAMRAEWRDEPAAQAWLWKDHTAHIEARRITDLATEWKEPYLAKCGGIYSSEWYWAKIAHSMSVAPQVAEAATTWIELTDFVPAWITGNAAPDRCPRSVCAAGHKAMWSPDWGGLPSADFLDSVQPGLSRFRYANTPLPSSRAAGRLTPEIATQVGLPAGLPVAVGAIDAHMGAVGAGIKAGTLVKTIGTSTCDCLVTSLDQSLPDIPGLCGVVPESILPGMFGLEAGQSAVGDIFSWFVQRLCPQEYGQGDAAHVALSAAAAELTPGASGLVALDWNNGNRTVLVDPLLTGLMVGQTLQTTAPEIYLALIEATAFGALTIVNRIENYGVEVHEVINCGGIAEKNPLVMQVYSDVLNRPMKVSNSTQTCALGAAIFASVVGGTHADVQSAQRAMTGIKSHVYQPIPERVAVYADLYRIYKTLHDAFGTENECGSLHRVMKDLIAIRTQARKG